MCIEEVYSPTNCTFLSDPNASCATGKIKTFCGGAGGTCCCDPAAASTYSCSGGSGCGTTIDCSCLSCPSGKQCMEMSTKGMFRCEEPPKP